MTDEELKTLANKVGMAIKLENPKARYACFFFAGESSKDDMLRTSATVKSSPMDWIAVIDHLLGDLEEEGVPRDAVLAGMLKQGPIGGKKERW